MSPQMGLLEAAFLPQTESFTAFGSTFFSPSQILPSMKEHDPTPRPVPLSACFHTRAGLRDDGGDLAREKSSDVTFEQPPFPSSTCFILRSSQECGSHLVFLHRGQPGQGATKSHDVPGDPQRGPHPHPLSILFSSDPTAPGESPPPSPAGRG